MRAVIAAAMLCLVGTGARAETASWYGNEHGQTTTATGEHYDPRGLTAASRTLPFGTRVRVCYSACVTVRINDRGPFHRSHGRYDRDIDLSAGAARAVGLKGVGRVSLQIIR
jgi:rare lipoprotein A